MNRNARTLVARDLADLERARKHLDDRARAVTGRGLAAPTLAALENVRLSRASTDLSRVLHFGLLDYLTLARAKVLPVLLKDLFHQPRDEANSPKTSNVVAPHPLAKADYLLKLITPPGRNEEFAGDLFEEYQRVLCKHGVRKANFYYWWQVIRSIPGMLNIRFRSLAMFGGLAKLYGELHKYLSNH